MTSDVWAHQLGIELQFSLSALQYEIEFHLFGGLVKVL